MESQLGSAGIDLGEAQTPLSEDFPEEEVLEQEVADEIIPEDKKEPNEPRSHSSEAKAELKSSDGAEDNSNVGVSEKEQDAVKSDVSSKTETVKGK
jgi:predicted AlkP superfamily phosphohydrolase/phosphomutase